MRKPRVLRLKTGGINHVLKERMGGLNKSFRKYAERTGEGNSKKSIFYLGIIINKMWQKCGILKLKIKILKE